MTRSDTKIYAEICRHFHDNPRKFWNWINSSKGRRNPIPTLLDDDIPVVDDRAKADTRVFNHYFHSVLTREDMSSFDTYIERLYRFSFSYNIYTGFSPSYCVMIT